MKITIDTKEDSHDEIRKVIRLLQNMVSQAGNRDMFSSVSDQDSSPEPSLFNMFGDNNIQSNTENKNEENPAQQSQTKEEQEDNTPEVTLY
ncbi:hypothetical protein GF323_00935 [Candidatus Woesearchaeota archaeon]|nr:hypothetical protein [Candidatus Woesearchaeota archaeon]